MIGDMPIKQAPGCSTNMCRVFLENFNYYQIWNNAINLFGVLDLMLKYYGQNIVMLKIDSLVIASSADIVEATWLQLFTW